MTKTIIFSADFYMTGKTLAFCLPILEQLIASKIDTKLYGATPRVLIMSPTRELARQIVDEFKTIGISLELRIEAIYGGTSLQANYTLFKDGIDVVVGTPGRIKDLLDKTWLSFLAVKHVVLDEADQMLSMGFQEEIQSIFAALKPSNDDAECDGIAPQSRQVLLFSATMPKWVHNLANEYLSSDREIVDLVSGTTVAATTTIQHIAIPAHWTVLGSVINDLISMHAGKQGKVMVFSCSKLDCDTIAVDKSIKHECRVLHGDIPQAKRESTLAAFKAGDFRVLVCTDVAARGLDLSVELVIQSKPPCKPNGKTDVETYVHRSGRTGRAGKTGICITYVLHYNISHCHQDSMSGSFCLLSY
jgi:ATP-dependent RNA helicase DDX21